MLDRVLVTGGGGYIGSHACKALAAAGYLPVTYDNFSRGHRHAVRWGPLEEGDITDRNRVLQVMRTHQPVAVMHFAALAYVGESVEQPLAYYHNNVGGSIALIDAALACGIDNFVLSSTCATYGTPQALPITEDTPQRPINPYGRTKLMVEQILQDAATKGLRSVMLRYFNAAGADPQGELAEEHDPETHLIPLVLDAAAGRRPAITVLGSDYPTPDGTCIRDYVHVQDLADAHVRALDYLRAGGATTAFNLGTGQGLSVAQIIAAAALVTGREIPVVHGARRPGDPPALVAQADRVRAVLGWEPRRSDIETIIADAWQSHQNEGA